MDIVSMIGSTTTVVSIVVFIGIVVWAYGARRKEAFDEAANAPFALPDDTVGGMPASRATKTQ
ncbi:MAG: CcoQ/FixQ family Cbb3-type cytochrome c oxidase assembly chaperone [Burkholderiales bacterium]